VLEDANTVATRARAVVLAGHAEPGDAAADAVVSAGRDDPDPGVRAYAVAAAERRGRRNVADRVRDLRDDAPQVRRRACQLEARAPRPSARVTAALVDLLEDPEPLVVVSATEALGEAGAVGAVDDLAGVAARHEDARCREAAIAALGALGAPEGLDAVLGGLDDKPAVRRRAVVALAAFTGRRVDAALARAAEDRDWQVREVAQALLAAGEDVG
jgi:HEAT repeat protein